jgi:hypothetical protein
VAQERPAIGANIILKDCAMIGAKTLAIPPHLIVVLTF